MLNSRARWLRDVVGDGALWLCVTVWLAFLLGLAGRWWWIADLFAALRIHYVVLFAVVCVIAAPLRRFGVVVMALAGTLVTGGSVLPYLRTADPVPVPASGSFRFVTFNKYWRNPDTAGIAAYLEGSQADVIALQEVESEATVSALAQHMPSYPFRYISADHNRTAVMFSRSPIRDSSTIVLVPGGASAARIVVAWRGHLVTVIGVHLHWPIGAENVRLRNAELARVARLPEENPGPLLIGGDFNVTAWSTVFSAALADSGLSDCASGQGLVQTWPAQVPPLAIRIDQCLHSRHWQVVAVSHGPALGSDHYPALNELVLRD